MLQHAGQRNLATKDGVAHQEENAIFQHRYVEQEQNEKEADETKQDDFHLLTIGTKSRNQPIECEILIQGLTNKNDC